MKASERPRVTSAWVSGYKVGQLRIPAHPLADAFPAGDVDALATAIARDGQRVPVVVDSTGALLLDGRTRALACERLGRPVLFTNAHRDDDVAGLVVSLNVARRHLNESQRAMVAARLSNLGEGRPSKTGAIAPVSQSAAGELLNVSRDSVKRAAAIRDDDVLAGAVDAGVVSVSDAAAVRTEPVDVRRAAVERVKAGTAPTLRAAVAAPPHVARATGEPEWNTPADLLDRARRILGGIDLDPASSAGAQQDVRARRFLTVEDDGLAPETIWFEDGAPPGSVWMNPPYDVRRIGPFVDRLLVELRAGRARAAVVLTNNGTETSWGQKLIRRARAICFPAGRVRFLDAAGVARGAPLQGQMIVGLGALSWRAFCDSFSDLGGVFPGGGARRRRRINGRDDGEETGAGARADGDPSGPADADRDRKRPASGARR